MRNVVPRYFLPLLGSYARAELRLFMLTSAWNAVAALQRRLRTVAMERCSRQESMVLLRQFRKSHQLPATQLPSNFVPRQLRCRRDGIPDSGWLP